MPAPSRRLIPPALVVLCAGLALGGCGDDAPPPVAGDVVDRLRALEGVAFEEAPTETPGARYFVLRFTQPVDHGDPGGARFEQRVSLLHRDLAAPLVVLTSGYWDYYRDLPYELTALLAANQISIEHRYFGESRPVPTPWEHLTIRQMADDQHRIITALRRVYGGAFVTTGGSKGGMTATYHRRFYPDDVEATVPYVAPLSLGAPDPRYAGFLDTIGPPACRALVRATATEMLARRRAELLALAQAQAAAEGHAYTRIRIGPALESSIVSFEWAFWQYSGVASCARLPATPSAADTAALWDLLDRVAPVSDNADAAISRFEAYYHQAYAELGYPDGGAAYLDDLLQFADADYASALPTAIPPYDGGAAMRDIDAFVRTAGERLLFVYGEWDPWTGGAYRLGAASASLLVTQPQGTHGARIARLAEPDRAAAFAWLAAVTGVTPTLPQPRRADPPPPREPRPPPALARALRARAR